jgi:hypothetical protein
LLSNDGTLIIRVNSIATIQEKGIRKLKKIKQEDKNIIV